MVSQVDFTPFVAESTGNRALQYPSPNLTYFNDHLQYHVPTSFQNSIFLAHPQNTGLTSLTFLHLGSGEAPNMKAYEQTCTFLEFVGHLASANSVFDIVQQLQRLETLTIFIGPLQQQYFSEDFKKSSKCPSVKMLKITLNKDYFHSLQHSECDNCSKRDCKCSANDFMNSKQISLIHLAQSLLIRAVDTFPNLRNLVVEMPRVETLCNIGQSLVKSCPRLKNKKNEAEAQQVSKAIERKHVARMTFKVGGSHEADGSDNVPEQNSPPSGFRCLPRLAKHELRAGFNVSTSTISDQGLVQLNKLHPHQCAHQRVNRWLDSLEM